MSKQIQLTETEQKVLALMMDEYSDRLSNDGSDDMPDYITNTLSDSDKNNIARYASEDGDESVEFESIPYWQLACYFVKKLQP
jgi:hypothetical protein